MSANGYDENDLPAMPGDTPEHDSSAFLDEGLDAENPPVNDEDYVDDDLQVELSAAEAAPKKKNSAMGLLIGGGLAGLLVLGGAGYFVFAPSNPPTVAQLPPMEASDSLDQPAAPDAMASDDLGGLPGATASTQEVLTAEPIASPVPVMDPTVAPGPGVTTSAAPAQSALVSSPLPLAAPAAAQASVKTVASVAVTSTPADVESVTELKSRVATLEQKVDELLGKIDGQRAAPKPAVTAARKAKKKVAAKAPDTTSKSVAVYEALPGYSVREVTSNGQNVVVRTPSGATVLLSKGERLKVNGKYLPVTAIEAKGPRVIIANRYAIGGAEAVAAPSKPVMYPTVSGVPVPVPPAPEPVAHEAKAVASASLKEATGWRVNAVFQGEPTGKPFLVQRPDNSFVRVGLGDSLPGLGVVRDASKDGRLTVGSYVIYPER